MNMLKWEAAVILRFFITFALTETHEARILIDRRYEKDISIAGSNAARNINYGSDIRDYVAVSRTKDRWLGRSNR